MLVYFLRHAEAEPDAGNDFARALTSKGLEQADKAGKFLVRHGLLPDAVISSPVVRARQTAKCVARKLGGAAVEDGPWLACGMTPEACLAGLQAVSEKASVLLVGHEPDFSETLAALSGMPDPAAFHVRKASLTLLDLKPLKPGCGRIEFLVPARLM